MESVSDFSMDCSINFLIKNNSVLGWGAAIFLFGAVVLLLCDKESEEIYYKERKIVHESSVMRD